MATAQPARTRVLARAIGPFLIVAGFTIVANVGRLDIIFPAFFQDAPLVLVTGVFTLAIGLAMVAAHNDWSSWAASAVSLLGWIIAIRGAVVMLAPHVAAELARNAANPPVAYIAAAIVVLLGAWLSFVGWFSKETPMRPDATFIAARIIGPLLIAIGIALITQSQVLVSAANDFIANPALRILGAVVGLAMGLTLVVLHPRWDGVSAAIISLIGWITILRGGVYLFAPALARDAALYAVSNQHYIPIAGCVIALIGVWLAYTGYISGTLSVERPRR